MRIQSAPHLTFRIPHSAFRIRSDGDFKMIRSALLLATAAILLSACSTVGPTQSDLVRGSEEPTNVVNYGLNYNLQRYSKLDQVNKSNVTRLTPVWTAKLDNELGEQAQPLVYNGVIYVSNAR